MEDGSEWKFKLSILGRRQWKQRGKIVEWGWSVLFCDTGGKEKESIEEGIMGFSQIIAYNQLCVNRM